MWRPSNPALSVVCIVLSLFCFSCSTVRYQQGYSYQPVYAGPDVASGPRDEKVIVHTENTVQQAGENTVSTHHLHVENTLVSRLPIVDNTNELHQSIIPTQQLVIPETSTQTEILSGIISKEYFRHQQTGQTLSTRERLHKMASEYAISTNKELTGKQLRKLDRLAAKMEKKQKKDPSDVSWGPSDNLEWFVLLGAGVALVVGILGIGVGWFVFLGLALVYLYLKLLKNN